MILLNIVKPWPQTLSPKPFSPKPKTKGPWADTKLLQATTAKFRQNRPLKLNSYSL